MTELTVAALWPLAFLLVVASAWRGWAGPPQSLDHEYGVVAAGLWLRTATLPGVVDPDALGRILGGTVPSLDAFGIPAATTVVILGFAGFVVFFEQAAERGDRWEHAFDVTTVGPASPVWLSSRRRRHGTSPCWFWSLRSSSWGGVASVAGSRLTS
jgi:hypothetical protein